MKRSNICLIICMMLVVILTIQVSADSFEQKYSFDKQRESMIWAPYLRLMARRPTALKYTGFFRELPTALQDYFNKCNFDEKRSSLNALTRMVKDTDIQTAAKALYLNRKIWIQLKYR